MPVHDTERLEVYEVCGPREPALETHLYTDGLHDQYGRELVASTLPAPAHDTEAHLGTYEVEQCLRMWADQRNRGLSPSTCLLHDGLVTVTPVDLRLTDVSALEGDDELHLCALDEGTPVEVVSWTATVDSSVLPTREPDVTAVLKGLRDSVIVRPKTCTREPGELLLDHVDPERTDKEMALRLLRLGTLGGLQLQYRLGASAAVAALRTIAASLDLDISVTQDRAANTARRWAQQLWPPDDLAFERGWHLPSVALRQNLEATALSLDLYPTVPFGLMNRASMTTMWLLSDGYWPPRRTAFDAVTDLLSDLTDLPDGAWRSLAASFDRDRDQDTETLNALVGWMGRGARPPHAYEFLPLVPTWLAETVRWRIAASAADLAVCRLAGVQRSDPLATVLAGSSLFDT